MSCRAVRRRFSAHRDGELRRRRGAARRRAPRGLRRLRARAGARCDDDARRAGRAAAAGVRGRDRVARLRPPGGGEPQARAWPCCSGPSWAARPLILPSLVPAALVLVVVLGAALALDRDPRAAAAGVRAPPAPIALGPPVPPLGHRAQPARSPSAEVSAPRARAGDGVPADLLDQPGRGHAVRGDGGGARRQRVRRARCSDGDSEPGGARCWRRCAASASSPARFRGRPVAVSVYRLISRMEVRAPSPRRSGRAAAPRATASTLEPSMLAPSGARSTSTRGPDGRPDARDRWGRTGRASARPQAAARWLTPESLPT